MRGNMAISRVYTDHRSITQNKQNSGRIASKQTAQSRLWSLAGRSSRCGGSSARPSRGLRFEHFEAPGPCCLSVHTLDSRHHHVRTQISYLQPAGPRTICMSNAGRACVNPRQRLHSGCHLSISGVCLLFIWWHADRARRSISCSCGLCTPPGQ